MNTPKISVIIAVLNMESSLQHTLESVVSQHYPSWELIVMDGGSSDGTLKIIEKYKKSIHFFSSQSDKGHIDACNKALKHVTGDFVLLLNADDVLVPYFFDKIAAAYTKNPSALMISCGCIIKNANASDKILQKPEEIELTLKNLLFGVPMINARLFHVSLFKKYGNFKAILPDGSYYISNDREFLTRLCLQGIKTEIIPEPLYEYFAHPQSLTFGQKNLIKIHEEHYWLADSLLKNYPLSQKQRALIKNWQTKQIVVLGWLYLKQKKYVSMLKILSKGFVFHFFQMFVCISKMVVNLLSKEKI